MAITNFEQVARDVLLTGDTLTGKDGRLYLDGNMTQAKVAEAIAEAIYVGDVFRDGQSVTKKYAVGAKAGDTIRVPLDTPFPSSSRTLKIGSRNGTAGNNGVINMNAPFMPADSEFDIVLNQVNDQMILFPDMLKEFMPIKTLAQKIASYAKTVTEDRTASTLAEILAYNIYRALNGGNNLKNITISTEDAYSDLLNGLSASMANGDIITNAHAYGTEGRCIIGRPSFIEHAFNRKSGVILTGSDLAQTMLKDISWDSSVADRDYVGNSYKGKAMGYHWQEASDYVWTLAERYLGLPAGSLDHVYAIACSYEANAVSDAIDLGVKIIDANEVRGLKAQPLNAWGHEAFRLSYIIGDANMTADAFVSMGFSADERKRPVAPSDLTNSANVDGIYVPIYDADGNVVGYKTVANVPKPNGGNVRNSFTGVTLTVLGTDDAEIEGATVTVTNGELTPTVTEAGDGVYTFTVGQETGASVQIAASGYTTKTVTISATDTINTAYALTVKLVASGS